MVERLKDWQENYDAETIILKCNKLKKWQRKAKWKYIKPVANDWEVLRKRNYN